MKYILQTEVNANGNLVFSKRRDGKNFYYFAQSEFGSVDAVTKEDIIRNAQNILNVRVSGDSIYPVKIQAGKGFTKEQIQQAINYVTETDHKGQPINRMHDLCEELRDNEEVVRAAMSVDQTAFMIASKRLRNNQKLAYEAVKSYSGNLIAISDELKRDKNFLLKCMLIPSFDLSYIDKIPTDLFKNDPDFCREVIKRLCNTDSHAIQIIGRIGDITDLIYYR